MQRRWQFHRFGNKRAPLKRVSRRRRSSVVVAGVLESIVRVPDAGAIKPRPRGRGADIAPVTASIAEQLHTVLVTRSTNRRRFGGFRFTSADALATFAREIRDAHIETSDRR